MISLEKASKLFTFVQSEDVKEIKALTGGYAGMVFKVATNKSQVVFKLYEEGGSNFEHVDDRVYGSNHDNLVSAHKVLKDNKIKTFDLESTGSISGYTYAIFSFLDGQEVNNEIIQSRAYVETLARIHSVRRSYQGWVSKNEPYDIGWVEAFSQSIHSRLKALDGILQKDLGEKALAFVRKKVAKLNEPQNYVLSHLDGLQALFKNEGGRWSHVGVIDVEDYQFTDQRFVLAGITLSQRFSGYALPQMFFDTYKSLTSLDNTFDEFEPLFQVYYLLVWIKVHDDLANQENRRECIEVLVDIV